jgi:hypothetical protein
MANKNKNKSKNENADGSKQETDATVGPDAQARAFTWGNTMACVATYKVLEGNQFMDEFEDTDTPFEKAGELKIGSLRFFPHATSNADILELLSLQIAQRFLTFVQKNFTIKPHKAGTSAAVVIRAVAKVFADADKTLTDVAEVVSENIDFPASTG